MTKIRDRKRGPVDEGRRTLMRAGVGTIPTLALAGLAMSIGVGSARADCFGSCKANCADSCVDSCKRSCMGDCDGLCGNCGSSCTGTSVGRQ